MILRNGFWLKFISAEIVTLILTLKNFSRALAIIILSILLCWRMPPISLKKSWRMNWNSITVSRDFQRKSKIYRFFIYFAGLSALLDISCLMDNNVQVFAKTWQTMFSILTNNSEELIKRIENVEISSSIDHLVSELTANIIVLVRKFINGVSLSKLLLKFRI